MQFKAAICQTLAADHDVTNDTHIYEAGEVLVGREILGAVSDCSRASRQRKVADMTIVVTRYDVAKEEEVEPPPEISSPWHHALLEVDFARQALVDAVEDGEIVLMPPSLPANSVLRSFYLAAWVLFKRGVPPRAPVRALPSFDPEQFLTLGDDDAWQVGEMSAHLRLGSLAAAVRAMTRLTPFVEPERREMWCEVLGVLRALQSRRLTLLCTWHED